MNKSKLKKHKKKPHQNSPVRKKPRLADNFSADILNEILEKNHDINDTETETDKELKKREQISFEEIRVDEQFMDTKT